MGAVVMGAVVKRAVGVTCLGVVASVEGVVTVVAAIAIGLVLGSAAGALHGAMLSRRIVMLATAARSRTVGTPDPRVARIGGTSARWVVVAALLVATLLVAGPVGLVAALLAHKLTVPWVGTWMLEGSAGKAAVTPTSEAPPR